MKKDKRINGLMIFILFAIAAGVVHLLVFSTGALQVREENKQNEEFIESIVDEEFAPISTQDGLSWDCNKSYYNGSQIITAEGEYLLFVCDNDNLAYFRLCPNGIKQNPLGTPDECL